MSEQASPPGAYLVEVEWRSGPGLICEVADWADGVRIIDPDGEDVTVDFGLRYVQARAADLSPKDAWRFAEAES